MKITAIVTAHSGESSTNDRFATELGKIAGLSVEIFEGAPGDAPTDGYWIVFDPSRATELGGMAQRTILIGSDRASVMRDLQQNELLGAVDTHQYFMWSDQGVDRGYGLIGRRDIASAMGAGVSDSGPYSTAELGVLSLDDCPDLPSLVGRYLLAADALLK